MNPSRWELRADCSRCAALCCVGPSFEAGADFALDKEEGVPCPHLGPEHRCTIHDTLRQKGFPACAAYDCFGAGQRVVAALGGSVGVSESALVHEAFLTTRALHALLWALAEARLEAPGGLRAELADAENGLDAIAGDVLDPGLAVRLSEAWGPTIELLSRCSDAIRRPGVVRVDEDLSGHDLRRMSLKDADLRFADLSDADLRGVDLGRADLLGADLRRARLDGADLGDVLFLSDVQVAMARGDGATRLPPRCDRPGHWSE